MRRDPLTRGQEAGPMRRVSPLSLPLRSSRANPARVLPSGSGSPRGARPGRSWTRRRPARWARSPRSDRSQP